MHTTAFTPCTAHADMMERSRTIALTITTWKDVSTGMIAKGRGQRALEDIDLLAIELQAQLQVAARRMANALPAPGVACWAARARRHRGSTHLQNYVHQAPHETDNVSRHQRNGVYLTTFRGTNETVSI